MSAFVMGPYHFVWQSEWVYFRRNPGRIFTTACSKLTMMSNWGMDCLDIKLVIHCIPVNISKLELGHRSWGDQEHPAGADPGFSFMGAQKDYVPSRTLRAQNRTHFRQGSRARFRVILMLSRAIWAFFLSILIFLNGGGGESKFIQF